MDDLLHVLRLLLEFVTAVAAIYASRKAKNNETLNQAVKKELDANPAKTVEAMARANGPLSGVLCRFKEQAEQTMPGDSPGHKSPPDA